MNAKATPESIIVIAPVKRSQPALFVGHDEHLANGCLDPIDQ
jgi:hypothetical protein